MKDRKAIIGIGNDLRGDDGIGPLIIARLKHEPFYSEQGIDLLDVGPGPLSALPFVESHKHNLILDCALFGKEPGYFTFIKPGDIPGQEVSFTSVHGFSARELVRMGLELYPEQEITILGVQPKAMVLGTPISDAVLARVPDILQAIKEFVGRRWLGG